MQNYSDDPSNVRVDFFKSGGKWYTTEAVKWCTYRAPTDKTGAVQMDGKLINHAFREALIKHLANPDGSLRLAGMWAICLRPYHEHEHPQMIKVPERIDSPA